MVFSPKKLWSEGTSETLNGKKRKRNPRLIAMAAGAGIVLLLALVVLIICGVGNSPGVQIASSSFLQEIVASSELSTYEAIYNGVTEVTAKNDPEEVLYYVSYNGTVKAGFDFSQVEIQLDHENQQILVTLPIAKITQVSVDITSLDFLFMDDKANTATVSQEAYDACVNDLTRESVEQPAIRQLARQNAESVILALLEPFVDQLGTGYTIVFA